MTGGTALVTGATTGIGAATARKLKALGWTVYGAARRADRLVELTGDRIRNLEVDLTDEHSIDAAVRQVVAETEWINVLIIRRRLRFARLAGDDLVAEGRRQFEVNVFGAVRLTQLILPHMRPQQNGRVVNVTSAGGRA